MCLHSRTIMILATGFLCLLQSAARAQSPAGAVPCTQLQAGDDANKTYFLMGPQREMKPPENGYGLLLIMPGAGVDDLLRRVESLLASAGAPPILVSIGTAPFEGTEGLSGAIPVADSAMYEEKKRRKLAAGQAMASA